MGIWLIEAGSLVKSVFYTEHERRLPALLMVILVNVLRKLVIMTMMSLMFVSMMNYSASVDRIKEDDKRIITINRFTNNQNDAVMVDSVRTATIKKILPIIRRYNRRMKDSLKRQIATEIYKMSTKYANLDVDLICATITHESARTWNPNVVSPAGALGLMQIMPHTGSFLSKHENIPWTTPEKVLFNPINNIRMGCRYLSMLIDLYNIDGGLAAYNGGERRAARWLASGRNDEVLCEETRGYIPAVLELYKRYKN